MRNVPKVSYYNSDGDVRIIDKKNVCLERCTNNRLLFKENTNFKGKLYCELRTR